MPDTKVDPYEKISQISKLFKQALSSVRPTPPRLAPSPPFSLILDLTPDVQAELDDQTLLPELRTVLFEAIEDLRSAYRRIFDKTCQEALVGIPGHILGAERLGGVLQRRFTQQALPSLLEKHLNTKQEIARSIEAASTIPTTSSKPFNNAFFPILTTYFLWNPFPPSSDKRILAEKGLMSQRQIDVWFQNRRAVVRKQTGVNLQKAHYKDKAAKGVPPDLLKQINEFTSHVPLKGYYGIGLSPDETATGLEKKRREDEERKWGWVTGWGSFGLSGLWERGKVVGRTVIERENAEIVKRGTPVDLLALQTPLPSQTMEEWAAQRKAGEITFDFSALSAPYSQRTTVFPTPAPPAHIPPPPVPTRKDAKASVRLVTEMFSDPGHIHFGDLGQRVYGEAAGNDEERERSGAATLALTRDVQWYVKVQRGAWEAALEYKRGEGARRRAEEEREREKQAKKEKRRQKEKEKKKRLGEKRTPTAAPRYEPYPTQAQSHVKPPAPSRSSLRSHASSSSISSTSSRTPSLTSNSSASSDDDDDMESLFGGPEPQTQAQQPNVKLAVEGFSVAGHDAYGSIGMGLDPNMGYPIPMNVNMPMVMGMGYGMDMNMTMDMGMNMNMGYGMPSMNWGLLPQMGNMF